MKLSTDERLMLPAQSGCKVCLRCTWTRRKHEMAFRCPYGGPFTGYQTSDGEKFVLGDTLVTSEGLSILDEPPAMG